VGLYVVNLYCIVLHMRRHPVTLRHTLLAAAKTYKPDNLDYDQQGTAVRALANLIMEMFDIPWYEDTCDTVTEIIEEKLSLDTGIAVINAAVRRRDEKQAIAAAAELSREMGKL
jgi:hypothetical protein